MVVIFALTGLLDFMFYHDVISEVTYQGVIANCDLTLGEFSGNG